MGIELYPFASHFFVRDGLRLHYLDEGEPGALATGDASPVVMLHGNPTWSFYFRDLVRGLRGTHRVIVPDHIGCGLSDKPDDSRYEYTLAHRVDDLEALLDHLGLTANLTLVLHDWGGMIGMAYASRHPERITRLVLLNTAAFLLPPGKRLPLSLWLGRNTALGSWLILRLNFFCRGALRWCVCRRLPETVRAGYLAPYGSSANRIAVLRFVQDIPLQPSDPSYALVRQVQEGLCRFRQTPTLICWGDQDFVFDQHFLAEWRRHLPQAEVHRFADAGHYVLEDAGAAILTLVREFLARTGSPTPRVALRSTRGFTPLVLGIKPRVERGTSATRGVNIASHVPAMARSRPHTLALVEPRGRDWLGRFRYRHLTFQELDRESDTLARGLQHVGITRGTRTALMVPPSLDFFALTFALFKLGAVIVLIDPGMGLKNLGVCLGEAEPEAFIGIPKAHLARKLLGWARPSLRQWVMVGQRFGWGCITLDQVRRLGKGQRPQCWPTPGPTIWPPSCSPAAARALPRAQCTRMASSPPRWRH